MCAFEISFRNNFDQFRTFFSLPEFHSCFTPLFSLCFFCLLPPYYVFSYTERTFNLLQSAEKNTFFSVLVLQMTCIDSIYAPLFLSHLVFIRYSNKHSIIICCWRSISVIKKASNSVRACFSLCLWLSSQC